MTTTGNSTLYVKFVNLDGDHHRGMKYSVGIHIDPATKDRGLYFCEFRHFPKWQYFGDSVAFVRVPDDTPVIDDPYEDFNHCLKAVKIEIVKIVPKDDKWIQAFSGESGISTDVLVGSVDGIKSHLYGVRDMIPACLFTEAVSLSMGRRFIWVPEGKDTRLTERMMYSSYELSKSVPAFPTAKEWTEAVSARGYVLENVPEDLKTPEVCMAAVKKLGGALEFVPVEMRSEEMCTAAVNADVMFGVKASRFCITNFGGIGPALEFVPEHLKTAEMCTTAMSKCADSLMFVPDCLKTAEMCSRAVREYAPTLEAVPDRFKTAEMCSRAVEYDERAFKFVPEKFRTEEMIDGLSGY